eukprot:SAG31_NODE_11101_length_1066_cov_1.207859_2_plen_74_part_00
MEQSCGAEDYAWTAEATAVQLIREIVGFREHWGSLASNDHGNNAVSSGTFILRPSLPDALAAAQTSIYTVRIF